ncbi:polar amino acid transport system permease protein [Psychromicrobium silvestre]|uniref:Polar amino acid transport system permease protein n=1 Tax=Psychromicrobium silvestre TaxID=1645614 RepID=A0A7Y9LRB0_9MICC|nr:polar amino acid transport system permease protein [Psychromicrobium silvestre]
MTATLSPPVQGLALEARSAPIRRIVPTKHPVRTVVTIAVVLVLIPILLSVLGNPRWEWGVVAQWFTAESVLRGLGATLLLTTIAGSVGFVLGLLLALMRISASPVLQAVSWTYTWIFRSVPLLVQLLLWYNLGYLYEKIQLGVPFGPVFFEVQTTTLISQFAAAVLGLTLHQAAYSSEIIRGGILSVDQGQLEAAAALGLPRRRRALRIVLPQALRAILPSAFNEIVGLVKGTSVVYVLAYNELFYTVQVIYNRTQQVLPLLLVATLWYVLITSVLSVAQYYIERRFARGALRSLPPTPWQRLRRVIGSRSLGIQP